MVWNYESFLAEGTSLVDRSSRFRQQKQCDEQDHDGGYTEVWEWRHGKRPHLPGNSFLVSTNNVQRGKRLRFEVEKNEFDGDSGMDDVNALLEVDNPEVADVAVLTPCSGDSDDDVLLYEFHIVFHSVYQTPVLYFRLNRVDGTPVRFDTNMLKELHLAGGNGRAALVSMEDHQVLGTPFYFLHPCETSSAMALLLSQPTTPLSINRSAESACMGGGTAATHTDELCDPVFLLAWLSLVQPLTQINPLQYQIQI